jgi:uncharacterized membrane protein YhaH (DUF805 family)
MTVIEAVTSYHGRTTRTDFWLKGVVPVYLAEILVLVPLSISIELGPPLLFAPGWFLTLTLAALWFQIPVWVKRLHDRNHSLWYGLIVLIPVVGYLWLLVELGFLRGTVGNNRFGEDPCERGHAATLRTPTSRHLVALALINALLIIGIAILIAVALPKARGVYQDYLSFDRTLPGLTAVVLNLGQLISRTQWAGLLLGCALWWNARFYYGSRMRKRSGLFWTLGVAVLVHVVLSMGYVPAIRLYRSHAQPTDGANQVPEDTARKLADPQH